MLHFHPVSPTALTSAQNRSIPPLRYGDVFRLQSEFPDLPITINGGITSLQQALELLQPNAGDSYYDGLPKGTSLAGVMIGRAAYNNPWLLANADTMVLGYSQDLHHTRREVLDRYLSYCDALETNERVYFNMHDCLRPLHNFFAYTGQYQTLYKRKLDAIVKATPTLSRRQCIQNDGSTNNYTCGAFVFDHQSCEESSGIVRRILESAIDGTIPESILDADPLYEAKGGLCDAGMADEVLPEVCSS